MSVNPATDAAATPVVPSSASSQRTATLVDSELSFNNQPGDQSDQNKMKPGHPYSGQQDWPAPPQPVHYVPGRSPPLYRTPSRRPTTSSSTQRSFAESSTLERGCSWGSSADWLRCLEGSGRTGHVKGVACVVIVLTIIFVVVLVLSLIGKKH